MYKVMIDQGSAVHFLEARLVVVEDSSDTGAMVAVGEDTDGERFEFQHGLIQVATEHGMLLGSYTLGRVLH